MGFNEDENLNNEQVNDEQVNYQSSAETNQTANQSQTDKGYTFTKVSKKSGVKNKIIIILLSIILIAIVAGLGIYFGYVKDRTRDKGADKEPVTLETSEKKETTKNTDLSVVVYDVSDLVAENLKSTVSVTCSQYVDNSRNFGFFFPFGFENDESNEDEKSLEESSTGSGFIVAETDEEIFFVTNYHVVEDSDEVKVGFIDGTSVATKVKGYDADADVAVLAAAKDDISNDTLNAIKVATIGDSTNLRPGEAAIVIGNAMGYGQSVTMGVISAVNREIELTDKTMNLIQTDAAINPGNSGGALFNSNGEVVGISTVKFASTKIEGMCFAIPISDVFDTIEGLINAEEIAEEEQGYFGIKGKDITNSYQKQYGMPAGVYVATVVSGSPADKAGIKVGDIITEFGGKKVLSMDELSVVIKSHKAGESVEVKFARPNNETGEYSDKTATVTLKSSVA